MVFLHCSFRIFGGTQVYLLELFSALHARQLELFHINFGEIILFPKINEAERIHHYTLICLLNIFFKIFTKVATVMLNSVVDHVVRPTQTAFIQRRNIMDVVVN
jgi:hypothetical protein